MYVFSTIVKRIFVSERSSQKFWLNSNMIHNNFSKTGQKYNDQNNIRISKLVTKFRKYSETCLKIVDLFHSMEKIRAIKSTKWTMASLNHPSKLLPRSSITKMATIYANTYLANLHITPKHTCSTNCKKKKKT